MKRFLLLIVLWTAVKTEAQQLNNSSFDSWVATANDTLPAQWKTSGFGVGRTLGMFGPWALEVWNWYYYSKGYAVNDPNFEALPAPAFQRHQGQPFSFRPVALQGLYRYLPGENQGAADSAYIALSFKRRNAITQQTDSLGFALRKFPPTETFTPFTLPIQLAGTENPDTLLVAIVSSINGFCAGNGNCLYLSVDNLQLLYPAGFGFALAEEAWSIRAVENRWKIETAEALAGTWIEVHNTQGKLLLRQSLSPYSTHIDADEIPSGMYLIRLIKSNAETSLTKKLMWMQP